jgi:hypothetical protein
MNPRQFSSIQININSSVKYFQENNKLFICLDDLVNHLIKPKSIEKYMEYNFHHKFKIQNFKYSDLDDILSVLSKSKKQEIYLIFGIIYLVHEILSLPPFAKGEALSVISHTKIVGL